MSVLKHRELLMVALVLVILGASNAPVIFGLTPSSVLSANGSIRYSTVQPDVTVSVNSRVVGKNELSLGFFLDGVDIRRWIEDQELRVMSNEANFKLVALFEHRLGNPCVYWREDDPSKSTWAWSDVDLLVERIFEVGAEPLMVLGFYSWTVNRLTSAPLGMETNWENTQLPKPETWAAYCSEWVRHFKSRNLPVRYYEVLHEPHHYFGWGGSNLTRLSNWMKCFNAAARAMRAENLDIMIGNDNSMVPSILSYILEHGEDLDFLSWHAYLTGTKSESDSSLIYKAEHDEGATYGAEDFIDPAREAYYRARGRWLPVIQSGANLNYAYNQGTDPRIQQMLNAITESLRLRMYILKQSGVTYNVYYHFAANGRSEEKFGMVDLDSNMPWYPYHVQWMMGNNLRVGDSILKSESSSDDVCSIAWTGEEYLNILLICKVKQLRSVSLTDVTGEFTYLRIDRNNPGLQKGTISSTEPFTLNGYTVMLLQTRSPY